MIFVAHPMSGDITENSRKVDAICKSIHSQDLIPVFPSHTWRRYLTNNEIDKALAEAVNIEYFRRGLVDEVWLYGHYMSEGMLKEVRLARKFDIPVLGKTPETERALMDEIVVSLGEKHGITFTRL